MAGVKIVSASAGSGKTYRLAYEFVRAVVADPTMYRHILAVTFTNKATEEMRERILLRLHELAGGGESAYLDGLRADLGMSEGEVRRRAREAQGLILHDYSRFAVLTIDRFFQRLIRAFIRELGIEVNFNIELETEGVLARAADALIDDSSTDAELGKRLYTATLGHIAQGESWDIRRSLTELGGELFGERWSAVAEGAEGAIEGVIVRAAEVRKLYSTRAESLLKTIEAQGLTVDDFRGKSRGLVPWLRKVAGGEFASMNSYVRAEVGQVEGLEEMERLYDDNFRLVGSAALLRENHHNFLLLSELQRRIERICRDENILPIAQTNRIIAGLVGGNDAPWIFEKAGTWYSRFFIDEFQDTSAAQWDNFVPLLRNAVAGEQGDPVMLIGDVKQAIYRWRGGDWQILSRRVAEEMGAGRVTVESLDVNHRSAKNVVEFNNRAVGLLVEGANTRLNALVEGGVEAGDISRGTADELKDMLNRAYDGHRQTPRSSRDEGYVTFSTYDETPPVVERVEDLLGRGFAPRDIAVLVRTNTQGAAVAQMLLAAGHQVVTGEALTVGAASVSRFIIAVLSLAVDPDDSIQRAVLNRWLGRMFDAPLDDGEFIGSLATMPPERAFEETVLHFGLDKRGHDVAYIQAVHQQIVSFSARSVADISLFLRWWNERGARASIAMGGGANAVTVSTIHKAKGLQWTAVVVPYLSWPLGVETRGRRNFVWADGGGGMGRVPINFKRDMASSCFAEGFYRESVLAGVDAVNLFYVAATRARTELHLMASTHKSVPKNSIGTLLGELLLASSQESRVKSYQSGYATQKPAASAAPQTPDSLLITHNSQLSSYPTSRPEAKVRMRVSAERRTGVSMHERMERVEDFDGLCALIGFTPADPQVRRWFTVAQWDEIRKEASILTSGTAPTRRPDRVMIKGDTAVVVDYKFGKTRREEYKKQLAEYGELLKKMGYRPRAHIWYVELDEVVTL